MRRLLVRIGIVAGTVLVIALAMPSEGEGNFRAEQGKPWSYGDFTAPFDFPIYKSDDVVRRERDSLLRQYEPYFDLDSEEGGRQVRRFVADHAGGIEGVPDDFISIVANRLDRAYQTGIMSTVDYSRLHSDTARTIRIVSGKTSVSVSIQNVLSEKAAYERIFLDDQVASHRAALQRCNLNSYISPNLKADRERSAASLNDLENSIPLAIGVVQKGQRVISRGDIVDEQAFRILESFKIENDRRHRDTTQQHLTTAGHALYVALFIIVFSVYLSLFRRDYLDKPRSVAMLYLLIIAFALLTSLLVGGNIGHVYLLPYAMVAMFARVFMDSRTAFITHFITIMVCAVMLQKPFEFITVQTMAGLAAIYSLRELQYRSQLFKTAVIVTAVAAATNAAFDLIDAGELTDISSATYKCLAVNGVLLLFAYPMMYVMEKAFGFVSDITLIELSNTNNPLLRKLSEVAPGTFQHSIMVGNLAAAVANKIGAQSQLVRTGALYHDIGKMQSPIYFTENQSGINPHATLSYVESAQIIISHVTEGLRLAEKNDLPAVIKDFISTHHGQGKAKYFYIKYKEDHPGEAIDDLLFTYPGTNPFTREQAILMMADTVEAASRSLSDYTEASLRALVDRLVDAQTADGFYRECPITFRDIAWAKTVLVDKLKTMYHTRVSYPKEGEKK